MGPVQADGGAVALAGARGVHEPARRRGADRVGGPLNGQRRAFHVWEADSDAAVRAELAADPWSGTHLVIESITPVTLALDGRE